MPLYKPPTFQVPGFNCPLCIAYAKQTWQVVFRQLPPSGQMANIPNLMLAACDHCGQFSIWLDKSMVFPNVSTAPLANPDLPKEVKNDYDEAREILAKSGRLGYCIYSVQPRFGRIGWRNSTSFLRLSCATSHLKATICAIQGPVAAVNVA